VKLSARARKVVYYVGLAAGVVGVGVSVAAPDIAATVADRLTGAAGLVGAIVALLARLHLTPDDDDTSEDTTDDAG